MAADLSSASENHTVQAVVPVLVQCWWVEVGTLILGEAETMKAG